ncbi:MAG TPA: DNA methyltransferase, partial [Chthoniobacteraceae bacterium]|nr:DNA methyltransferase [Chthoniobacteraceae bacterium]
KGHQAAIVRWMVEGGRRACFGAFGLGKSVIQLEAVRAVLEALKDEASASQGPRRGLIVAPLGVRQEFRRDAVEILGWKEAPVFVRRIEECGDEGIYLTNYETIRDGKLDPAEFSVASLDEASILRGLGGTKTFRECMRLFTGDAGPCGVDRADGRSVPYRFVATATPSPNEYIELLAYAEFLGIMDVSQAKTRFFKRDSTKADELTLHAHKEREFWLWVSSWAVFVQRPSDLGFPDEGYALPEVQVHWHEVPSDHSEAGFDVRGALKGHGKLFRDAAIGVQDSAAEKRNSLPARIARMMELRALDPLAHRVLWHDLEAERVAIERAIREEGTEVASVYGSQDLEEREDIVAAFSDGRVRELATKPVLCGSGCNFQRHCAWEIFLGIGFKFNDFIQAIHRVARFLQTRPVRIDIIYTEAERGVRKQLERKWEQHNEMVKQMTNIIKEYGLNGAAMVQALTRKMGVGERIEVRGRDYTLVNDDCVLECKRMRPDSVGLVLTSIPFSTQYEYSPNYADFGHSDGNNEFFEQMDYLAPELFRVLMPGRVLAVHVKDRVVPGGMTGLGFQTVYPFHLHTIAHYVKHGFGYMGMKTIVTDVVRENNQTYRLGWTEQCKDGSKMGVGMPEYLLLFRKPPTDRSNSYADVPVVKRKERYTRSRWQIDAHGFARSSGDRLLSPEELLTLKHADIFKLFRDYSLREVYDFEHHVKIGETLEASGRLPVTFMLLQPQSWHDDVWTDITRMRTLNATQWSKGKEMHLCPMQFDLADRVIEQMSNEGETVLDPFGGLMTVPYRAIKLRRKAIGIELNPAYFTDGAAYCKSAEEEMAMPGLFDVAHVQQEETEITEAVV